MHYKRTSQDAIIVVCANCSENLINEDWSLWDDEGLAIQVEGEALPVCCGCGNPVQ